MQQSSEQRATNDATARATASTPCPRGWWHMALLILLLNTTMFFHGCERGDFCYSVGAVAPFLEVAVENRHTWPSRIMDSSAGAFFLNVLLATAALWAIRRYCPPLARELASRRFIAALSLSVALLNSFLASPRVWSYVAWWPTLYVVGFFEWLLYRNAEGSSNAGRLDVVIGSRVYFLLLLTVLYLLLRVGAYLLNRFVLVAPTRWWQFQLGGLMGIAVFLGTAIGLLVRIFRQSR